MPWCCFVMKLGAKLRFWCGLRFHGEVTARAGSTGGGAEVKHSATTERKKG